MARNQVVQPCPSRGESVKKVAGLDRLCFAPWNIGSSTSKSIELVKPLHRRKVNIACVQENKLVGAKAREIDGYQWCYSGSIRARNGNSILVENEL